MKTGIVILNYNNFTDTINCIQSVHQYCSTENLIITIVDNGSGNDSIAQISSYLKASECVPQIIENTSKNQSESSDFYIIPTKKNLGYAQGNNVGIQFLLKQQVDNILILNNDIILTSNIINTLAAGLDSYPEIGLISPLLMKDEKIIDYNCCRNSPSNYLFLLESLNIIEFPLLKKKIDEKYLLKQKPELLEQDLIECDIVSGACIMAKASTWKKLKGFDANTFLYFEENILFEKLSALRMKSAILSTVQAIHLGARATNKVHNTKILKIEMDSLRYYLETYRKIGFGIFSLIMFFKTIRIQLIVMNNFRKKIIPISRK